jgi:hypothetical protein
MREEMRMVLKRPK